MLHIYSYNIYICIYLIVVDDCATVRIISNHHCASHVIPIECCPKYQFRRLIITMYDM